ncbi:MAG: hypothetical protein Q8M07_29545 [Prosthecobacter sp.]|nr:hypothetical protein [Prosthecobacter sp.]
MIAKLPPPGSVFPEAKQADWLSVMAQVLRLEYPGAPEAAAPVSATEDETLLLETRVWPTPAGVAFADRLKARSAKKGPKAEAHEEPRAETPQAPKAPKAPVPIKRLPLVKRDGLTAREMISAVLSDAKEPLPVRALVERIEKRFDTRAFKNLRAAVDNSLKQGDGRDFSWDIPAGGARHWFIKRDEA